MRGYRELDTGTDKNSYELYRMIAAGLNYPVEYGKLDMVTLWVSYPHLG